MLNVCLLVTFLLVGLSLRMFSIWDGVRSAKTDAISTVHFFQTSNPNPPQANLKGTSWRLVKFQGSDDSTLTPDDKSKYTIMFGTDGRVTVRLDCNRGGATWKSPRPNQLEFGPLVLTRAMCPPGSLHDQIAMNWSSIRSYVIKDGNLFLSLMADGGIYEFESASGSYDAGSIFGRRWRLTEIKAKSVKTTKAYIELDRVTKRFSGAGGCNRISGGFQINAQNIRFLRSISTMRACIDSEVQKIETEFFTALAQITKFEIQDNTLRLYAGGQQLLTFSSSSDLSGSAEMARVSGTITYRERVALTSNAVIEVKLLDVSRADAPAVTIAEQTINPAGRQVPIPFDLAYDPNRIQSQNRYSIQVRILEGGQLRFINSQAYPVITGGHAKTASVIVTRVSK